MDNPGNSMTQQPLPKDLKITPRIQTTRHSRRQFLALVAGIALSRRAGAATGDDQVWNIATIGDIHIADEKSVTLLNKAVANINKTPNVAFTVILGDLSTAARSQELRLAKECLNRLTSPFLTIPGNHDVTSNPKTGYGAFEEYFGPRQWTKKQNGWLFIGLDSCNGTESDVEIPTDRIEWIKQQLQGLDNNCPIGLFSHHPFNPHTKAYRVKNADAVLAAFSGRNLKFVAAGHYHGNQTEVQNGILFTTTACCAAYRPNFDGADAKGYRIFQFRGPNVTTDFVPITS